MHVSTDDRPSSRRAMVIGVLVTILLVGLAGVAVYLLVDLPAEVLAPTLAAVLTAGVGIYSVNASRRTDRVMQIEEAQRPQKVAVYEEFMAFWFNTLFAQQTGRRPPTEAEMMKFFATFTQKVIAWGSDKVIAEYGKFRTLGGDSDPDGIAMIAQFEQVLLAIRADLGHDNAGVSPGSLVRLFVTDWETHAPTA